MRRHWPSDRRLAAASVAILVAGFALWSLLLWAGWILVFAGDTDGVVASDSRTPASFAERIYFVGFSVTTFGIGRESRRLLLRYICNDGWAWEDIHRTSTHPRKGSEDAEDEGPDAAAATAIRPPPPTGRST